MFCSKCGERGRRGESFCRNCGAGLDAGPPAPVGRDGLPQKNDVVVGMAAPGPKDPDELTGEGIGKVIVGDGFFIVAVILAASQGAVGSLLWLFLLIPAFYFFGKGCADVLHANQIRRRMKQGEAGATREVAELPPPRASVVDAFMRVVSGELTPTPSVTEKTTRQLE
jgi:hypothetical protein